MVLFIFLYLFIFMLVLIVLFYLYISLSGLLDNFLFCKNWLMVSMFFFVVNFCNFYDYFIVIFVVLGCNFLVYVGLMSSLFILMSDLLNV